MRGCCCRFVQNTATCSTKVGWHLTESRTRIRRSLRHPCPIKPRVLIVLYQLFSISRTHPSFEIATAFSINYRNDPISRVFRDAWLLWVRVSQSTAGVNFFEVCEPFDVLLTWELLYNFLGFPDFLIKVLIL